jgi:hypothetical protein
MSDRHARAKQALLGVIGCVLTTFLISDALSGSGGFEFWSCGAAVLAACGALAVVRPLALRQTNERRKAANLRLQALASIAVIVGTFAAQASRGSTLDPLLAGAVGGMITSFLLWSPTLYRGQSR